MSTFWEIVFILSCVCLAILYRSYKNRATNSAKLLFFIDVYRQQTGKNIAKSEAILRLPSAMEEARRIMDNKSHDLSTMETAIKHERISDFIYLASSRGLKLTHREGEEFFWLACVFLGADKNHSRKLSQQNPIQKAKHLVNRMCREAEGEAVGLAESQSELPRQADCDDSQVSEGKGSPDELTTSLRLIWERRRASHSLLTAHLGSATKATEMLALLKAKGFISKPEGPCQWNISFDKIDSYLKAKG